MKERSRGSENPKKDTNGPYTFDTECLCTMLSSVALYLFTTSQRKINKLSNSFFRLIFCVVISSWLVGCSDTNSTDAISQQSDGEVPSTNTGSAIDGGSPDSPVLMGSGNKYVINNSDFYNYFIYSGIKDERISIKSSLTLPVSDRYITACHANISEYANISVYDSDRNVIDQACGENIDFFLPEDGSYTFHFDFSSNGSGNFNLASTITDSAITSPEGIVGSPSSPNEISVIARNTLSAESFFNHYKYTSDQGSKLVVSVFLDAPLTPSEKAACPASPDIYVKSYGLGVAVFDRYYNDVNALCGEDYTFTFPDNGTYIFYFSYAPIGSGYFDAAIID